MRYANSIDISVYIKPEDSNPDEISNCLRNIMPLDIDKEKTIIDKQVVEGFNNRNIIIYTLKIVKESHTNLFIKTLLAKLNKEQIDMLINQTESRLDDNLEFFIRLDKTSLLKGEYKITESGDCYHIRIRIAAHPRKREAAIQVIEQMFKGSI